ncbi:MAG: hypothetical protein KAI33_07970 [Elusimicrobiales bacterium]|nr:hypothetical protein [Elusimicrobiales bacterium]
MKKELKNKTWILTILIAFFIYCFNPMLLFAETHNLTTYYPSPYGGYAKLLTTDSTVLARDGGRVGIGTETPGNILEIKSNKNKMGLDINNMGGGISQISFKRNNASKWTIMERYPNAGYLSIFNDTVNKAALVIDPANNIGIGTTNPSPGLKLDVQGKVGAKEYCDENGLNCVKTKNLITSSPITSYTASCDKCNKVKNLGPHKLCVLSGIGGPGGFNTSCRVYKNGNIWHLRVKDGDKNNQTHRCWALCFD